MPLLVDWNLKTYDLLIESVQEIVTRPVRSIASPGKACSAKRSLGDLPFFGTGEKGSPVFHFDHPLRGFSAHDLNRILISQIVASLDRIKGVVFPGVLRRSRGVSQGGVDSSLGSHRVGSQRMDFRQDRHVP